MATEWWFRDGTGLARKVKEAYFRNNLGAVVPVKEGWFRDAAGVPRKFFSSAVSPSAANFTISNAQPLSDTLEGSGYGMGVGFYGSTNQSDGTTVPAFPPPGVGESVVACLFTSNGNSGDVGLPQNQLIYAVNKSGGVPNTDASFAQMAISTLGNFARSAATYSTGPSESQWVWTTAGPYFQIGQNYTVSFT